MGHNVVPPYSWSPPLKPWETKQRTAYAIIFRCVKENPVGSGKLAPYDLTGLTLRFTMKRDDPDDPGNFTTEILDGAAVVDSPPEAGVGRYNASALEMDVPAGDHCGEVAILSGGVVVDRLPRGNAYMRIIVGETLGT